ncbi:hypothetical protein [Effusibacillus lacus]|uniref:Uncharacterized protein n=1 Tax=Effusibacillus lacus TaxID=1348429 RepID=A0A292YED8_9BACL|nr:hypothetical protein [Effusibacillus lacus]TCS76050.1 hypothetical protein EDD64_10421 [Effusibacillus lacus]GAX91432.1 hypothetical protein EFBL_3101 [Effusibacillus lacus]
MAKHQPGMNLPEVLKAFAWLDVYLDSIKIETGVPDLYHAVYGRELPSIQIDLSDTEPMLLFDLCDMLEKNGYQDLVQEFFSLLVEHRIDVTSWTMKDIPNRKRK